MYDPGFAFDIGNLFDKKPMIMCSNQGRSNTYPDVYDVLFDDSFVAARFNV